MSECISPLRRRMIEDMMVRKLAPTTQGSSAHAVKKFSPHFSRSPDCLALEETKPCRLRFGATLGRKELL
jgi:hypothetical protein